MGCSSSLPVDTPVPKTDAELLAAHFAKLDEQDAWARYELEAHARSAPELLTYKRKLPDGYPFPDKSYNEK